MSHIDHGYCIKLTVTVNKDGDSEIIKDRLKLKTQVDTEPIVFEAKSDKTQNIKTCPAKSPAKCQAPLAISPMPSENYWICHKCGDLFDTQARLDKHEVTWGAKHTHPC